MLHTETVTPATLDLIYLLQKDTLLNGFYLVGGTALSLQIGHRISVDIVFFTRDSFETSILTEHLEESYGFKLHYSASNTLKGYIGEVLIDLLRHDYPYVIDPVNFDGIRMLSKKDIAAFKVNAITGSGTRAKDFVDIYFLLKELSFSDIIDSYNAKYCQRNDYHAVKSLIFFDDMDLAGWPNLILEKNLTPAKLKSTLTRHCELFLK
jgi:hypothetical protein